MATFHRVVSLGIIVLIASCFVHSRVVPSQADRVKDEGDSNRIESESNRPKEHEQEDQQSKLRVA